MLVIHGWRSTAPAALVVNGTALTESREVFTSLRKDAEELWVTLGVDLMEQTTIEIR